jgi:hypothetical protein
MVRLPRRRPSAATVIALLALFVALGGPAQAAHLINGKLLRKGTVTGRAIKDRSLDTHDLSRSAVRRLETTPPASVTELQLANGAVTPGKIARGAVGPAALAAGGVTAGNIAAGAVNGAHVADGSLTGADIADGSLTARDVTRFSGRFSAMVGKGTIDPHTCWSGEPVNLAPEQAHANIGSDVVLVTPGPQWPDQSLSLTVRQSSIPSRFVLIACNPTDNPVTARAVDFSYAVLGIG